MNSCPKCATALEREPETRLIPEGTIRPGYDYCPACEWDDRTCGRCGLADMWPDWHDPRERFCHSCGWETRGVYDGPDDDLRCPRCGTEKADDEPLCGRCYDEEHGPDEARFSNCDFPTDAELARKLDQYGGKLWR